MRKPARFALLLTLTLLFASCATDRIAARKPTCPVFPVPSEDIVQTAAKIRNGNPRLRAWLNVHSLKITDQELLRDLEEIANPNPHFTAWWIDLAQFATKCNAIRMGVP